MDASFRFLSASVCPFVCVFLFCFGPLSDSILTSEGRKLRLIPFEPQICEHLLAAQLPQTSTYCVLNLFFSFLAVSPSLKLVDRFVNPFRRINKNNILIRFRNLCTKRESCCCQVWFRDATKRELSIGGVEQSKQKARKKCILFPPKVYINCDM